MITMILRYIGVKIVRRLLRSKWFWITAVLGIILLTVIINPFRFFLFTMIMDKQIAKAEQATTSLTENILEIYQNDLLSPSRESTPQIGTEPNNTDKGSKERYSDTKNMAEKIEGTSLLHQVHNALVAQEQMARENGVPFINYTYYYGTSIKEATPLENDTWIPFLGVDLNAMKKPGFNLLTSGVDDITNFSQVKGKFDSSYIGSHQVDFNHFYTSGRPTTSWTLQMHKDAVANSKNKVDVNGDGKSDPFNYIENLRGAYYHALGKWNSIKDCMQLSTNEDYEDMVLMQLAARYVGISGRQNGGTLIDYGYCAWERYPHSEEVNPHFKLYREAIKEYKTKGKYYRRVREIVLQNKHTNGCAVQAVVNDFYKEHGWKVNGTCTSSGISVVGTDSQGRTMRLEGQNVHYVFLVYWGGKIGQEEIEKVLND